MLHIEKRQNILLKGIGLLSPAVGIRSQYENIKDQINEQVDQVIESLNKDESTNARYLADLLNIKVLLEVVRTNGLQIGETLDYLRNNVNNVVAFDDLGLNVEGVTFGDVNLIAYDLTDANRIVIQRFIQNMLDIIDMKAEDDGTIDLLTDAIVQLGNSRLSFDFWASHIKKIEPTEDNQSIFLVEFQEWFKKEVDDIAIKMISRPESGILVVPEGFEELKDAFRKNTPSKVHDDIENMLPEDFNNTEFLDHILKAIIGRDNIEGLDLRVLSNDVKILINNIKLAIDTFMRKNHLGEIEIPMQDPNDPSKTINTNQLIPSTVNLPETLLCALVTQSSKLHDESMTMDKLKEDTSFMLIYNLYNEVLSELLGNRITDNTVCKYISCIAANIQTISFINPILRVKDQNIGTAVYTIREIIHDEYIAAGKIAKDPEPEVPEELLNVSEDPMNRGE